jgi:hypothetical protein
MKNSKLKLLKKTIKIIVPIKKYDSIEIEKIIEVKNVRTTCRRGFAELRQKHPL